MFQGTGVCVHLGRTDCTWVVCLRKWRHCLLQAAWKTLVSFCLSLPVTHVQHFTKLIMCFLEIFLSFIPSCPFYLHFNPGTHRLVLDNCRNLSSGLPESSLSLCQPVLNSASNLYQRKNLCAYFPGQYPQKFMCHIFTCISCCHPTCTRHHYKRTK